MCQKAPVRGVRGVWSGGGGLLEEESRVVWGRYGGVFEQVNSLSCMNINVHQITFTIREEVQAAACSLHVPQLS